MVWNRAGAGVGRSARLRPLGGSTLWQTCILHGASPSAKNMLSVECAFPHKENVRWVLTSKSGNAPESSNRYMFTAVLMQRTNASLPRNKSLTRVCIHITRPIKKLDECISVERIPFLSSHIHKILNTTYVNFTLKILLRW